MPGSGAPCSGPTGRCSAVRANFAKPGDYIADDIAGWPVFVIRAKDGTLRGFHNVCRHRAGPLVGEGAGHCNALRCKYHGWLYDTDGALRKAPGLELGKDIEAAEFGLHPVRVGVWNGLVFACLEPDAPDLEAMARRHRRHRQGLPVGPGHGIQGSGAA